MKLQFMAIVARLLLLIHLVHGTQNNLFMKAATSPQFPSDSIKMLLAKEAQFRSEELGRLTNKSKELPLGLLHSDGLKRPSASAPFIYSPSSEVAALDKALMHMVSNRLKKSTHGQVPPPPPPAITSDSTDFVKLVGEKVKELEVNVKDAKDTAQRMLDDHVAAMAACTSAKGVAENSAVEVFNEFTQKSVLHKTCRAAEHSMSTTKEGKCQLASELALEKTTLCENPYVLDITQCEPTQDETYKAWLSRKALDFQKANSEATEWKRRCDDVTGYHVRNQTECDNQVSSHSNKKQECDTLSGEMDTLSCNRASSLKANCASYDECYDGALTAYSQLEASVKQQEPNYQGEWHTLQRIECLLEALGDGTIASADAQKIDFCMKKVIWQSHIVGQSCPGGSFKEATLEDCQETCASEEFMVHKPVIGTAGQCKCSSSCEAPVLEAGSTIYKQGDTLEIDDAHLVINYPTVPDKGTCAAIGTYPCSPAYLLEEYEYEGAPPNLKAQCTECPAMRDFVPQVVPAPEPFRDIPAPAPSPGDVAPLGSPTLVQHDGAPNQNEVTVMCPPDTKVISGGCAIGGNGGILVSNPDDGLSQWTCMRSSRKDSGTKDIFNGDKIRAYALCVAVAIDHAVQMKKASIGGTSSQLKCDDPFVAISGGCAADNAGMAFRDMRYDSPNSYTCVGSEQSTSLGSWITCGTDIVVGSAKTYTSNGRHLATATCGSGERVIGGGCQKAAGSDSYNLYVNAPSGDKQWTCAASGSGAEVVATALCKGPQISQWELIAKQNVLSQAFETNAKSTFLMNSNDPAADAYMKIGNMNPEDDSLKDGGKYYFKLVFDGSTTIEWKQSSWITANSISGFECVSPSNCGPNPSTHGTSDQFAGLGKSESIMTVLDGNAGASGYWNSVGYLYKGDAFPAWNTQYATTMELFIKRAQAKVTSYALVKRDVECKSSDKSMGQLSSAQECANAVADDEGTFFIYGTGSKAGRCYKENTASADCSEGWEDDQYDFYTIGR